MELKDKNKIDIETLIMGLMKQSFINDFVSGMYEIVNQQLSERTDIMQEMRKEDIETYKNGYIHGVRDTLKLFEIFNDVCKCLSNRDIGVTKPENN